MVTGTLTVGFEVYERLQIMLHIFRPSEAIRSHEDEISASITD